MSIFIAIYLAETLFFFTFVYFGVSILKNLNYFIGIIPSF